MSLSDLPNILFVFFFFGFLAYSVHLGRKRKKMFERCAEQLEMKDFKQTGSSLSGVVRGLRMEAKFHASTKNTPAHTTIDVTFEPCTFLLHLRRQDAAELKAVAEGKAIDIALGDADFDAAWIVEGAPVERVVRVLSSPELRRDLMAFAQLDNPSIKIEDGKLQLYRRGTEVTDEWIQLDRMKLALALAEAVVTDAQMPLQPGEIDAAASSYRTVRRVDADAQGAAQVAELKLLRATRAMSELQLGAIVGHLFTTMMFLAFQLMSGAGLSTLAALLFPGVVGIGIWIAYSKQKKEAPSLSFSSTAVLVIAGCWVVNGLLVLRAFLTR